MAWGFYGSDGGKTRMIGVSVAIHGLKWPLIISWKDSHGYERMMEAIESAKTGKGGDLLVQVKCIRK